jgi:hypothetical protein
VYLAREVGAVEEPPGAPAAAGGAL